MTDNKKRGRPKSNNPKSERLEIRLTVEEYAKIERVAKKHGLTKTDAINKGVDLLDNLK